MMEEFIHWLKETFSCTTTCDEILSRMIEIWMKNHLEVAGLARLWICTPQFFFKGKKTNTL